MIIKVKNLRPNPFRDLNICPIDRDKIERLKKSIEELEFWDNLIARKSSYSPEVYELAYGYHRLIALQELGIDEVNIPVKQISDEMMIKIMAEENHDWYGNTTAIVNETVKVAKEYIEAEINKKDGVYEDLEDWCKDLFDGEQGFRVSLGKGLPKSGQSLKIGRKIIHNFLGDTWSKHDIELSLKLLYGETEVTEKKEDPITGDVTKTKISVKISKEAAEEFDVVGQSRAFVDAIAKSEDARSAFYTPESQVRVAKEIKAEVLQEQIEEAKEKNLPVPTELKITSSVIAERVQEKAEQVLEKATTPRNDDDIQKEEVLSQITKVKVPNALKEIRAIYDKVVPDTSKAGRSNYKDFQGLSYPDTQNVFTKRMGQQALNMLYMINCHLHEYLLRLQKDLDMEPEKDVMLYDIYDIYDPHEHRKHVERMREIWEDEFDPHVVEIETDLADLEWKVHYDEKESDDRENNEI